MVLTPRSEAVLREPPTPEQREVLSREIRSIVQQVITALGMIGPAAGEGALYVWPWRVFRTMRASAESGRRTPLEVFARLWLSGLER